MLNDDPMRSRGRAVCGILPPHILIAICENGTAQERGWALATLVLSERLRARRQLLADLPAAVPAGEMRRTVYDAKHSETLPGRRVRAEGSPPSSDAAVNEAYDGAGATYDLYAQAYGRNSIDGRGMRLDSSVHYGVGYDNAFWSGAQMVYGDGDGKLFERFTKAVDVIGHELTHGVTAHEARLDYHDQPGALNESFFGRLRLARRCGREGRDGRARGLARRGRPVLTP